MRKVLLAGLALTVMSLEVERGALVLDAQDRVDGVLAAARDALGGDKLTSLEALSAEGPFRRSMGQRDMEGTLTILVVRPDKLRRSEELSMAGMAGGPTIERISALNGAEAWDDMQNRGGMGGGMQIMMRGPDGPGGPGVLSPEQIEQARVRRMRTELQRWTVALLLESPQPFTDAGVAESPEGKADILETKDEAGRPVRLFIGQETHLPLMLQYQEVRPRMNVMGGPRGGPGGGRPGGGPPRERPSEEEMKQRMEELRKQGPPEASPMAMYFTDYRDVDGVMLPHKMSVSVNGQPNEEWTVEKFRVNPNVKPSEFEKPK
jgi:hypothetical protein